LSRLFQLEGVGVRYGEAEILRDISLSLHASEFVAIAGPNGAGKSTLLNLLAGLAPPSQGTCKLMDRAAHQWPRREFAQRVAVVQQAEPAAFPFTAEEVVYMGRMPHSTGLTESQADHIAVADALEQTGMSSFRNRDFRTLSGGEKQRVLLAAALAQAPEILLLDEPANHLDLHHQIALHRILRNLTRKGLLIVAVTHDLNLAAAYADRIILLHQGRIHTTGSPADVLRGDIIAEVFQVHVALHQSPSGQPWMIYGE